MLVARMRSFRWFGGTALLASALLFALAVGVHAAAASRYMPPGEKWTKGFRLEPGVTYTYVMSTGDRGRPAQRFEERGRLNIWLAPGGSNEIRFWYTLDGVHRNGTAPNDPLALAGAVLLSALSGPEPLSLESLKLLVTPFQWVQWAELFLESSYRNGVVWEVNQHPPLRFSAARRGPGTFEGEITSGRDRLLELRINLSEPLPERVVSHYSSREVYRAEIETAPQRRVLR